MLEHQAQQCITKSTRFPRRKQFPPGCFKQLPIFNSSRTHLFASATAETTINMAFEAWRVVPEPAFADSPHQIKTSAWSIVFVTGDGVCRAGFETQPAVNTREQFLFFSCEG